MALSKHEQDILVAFTEEHFKDLPKRCIEIFKEEPRLPGYGKVEADESDWLTMKVSLSLSLVKSYEVHTDSKEDLCWQLADLFAQEYMMHLSHLFLETMTNDEDMIITTISKLLKYVKMERNPILITSPNVAAKFVDERGFIASSVTQIDIESGYFYEFGKIRNLVIVVDPLQKNENYAYLLTGNIMNYKMGYTNDETFITYQLTDECDDLIAIFKPTIIYYQFDLTGMNYKFFTIVDEENNQH